MKHSLAALRTIVWMPIFYLGTVVIVLATVVAAFVSHSALMRVVRCWSLWHYGCARWLLGQRVVVEGEWPAGTSLFVVKHEAMFETIDMPRLLPNPAVFAKRELFSIPLWGWLAARYGLIPIDRDAGAKALRAMRLAARDRIAQGRPLVLFPEGTRVPHGERPPIRSGFAGLYRLLDLPAVPVAVDSGRLRDGWVRLPGLIRYRVGEVIPTGLPREEAEMRVYAAINALNSDSV